MLSQSMCNDFFPLYLIPTLGIYAIYSNTVALNDGWSLEMTEAFENSGLGNAHS